MTLTKYPTREFSNSAVTALRGFLALAIVWHHLSVAPLFLFGKDFSTAILFPGRISVWLFFVLSGYAIYAGYSTGRYRLEHGDILRFYYNRVLRIIPLMFTTVFIGWLILMYQQYQDIPNVSTIIRTMFLLDINFKVGVFQFMPTWFIGVLMQLYLFAPVLVGAYKKLNLTIREKILALLLFSFLCRFGGYLLAGDFDIRNALGAMPLFVFGFFAFDIFASHKEKIFACIKKYQCTIWFVLFVFLEASFFLYALGWFFYLPMEPVIGFLGVGLLLLLLHRDSHKGKRSIGHTIEHVLRVAGQQSYGIYLWHPIVIHLVLRTGIIPISGPPYQGFSEFVLAFLVIAVGAYFTAALFQMLVEKPYQRSSIKRQNMEHSIDLKRL